MGNVCPCCSWGRGGVDSKTGIQKKLDKKDKWFEQDSVPLVSARYDLDDVGSDEADGILKRTVLLRSPRPTSTSTSVIDIHSNRPPRHHHQQYGQEEQYHSRRVKSASVDSGNYSRHSSRRSDRGDDEERPRSHHRHSRRDNDSDDRPWHSLTQRTTRSSSLEVQDSSHREMRSPSSSAKSPRVTSQSQDAASFADDEIESVDSSTRSHRSSSASSSPKASRSSSPQKKPRYGRKHYRADVNRK